MLDTSTTFPVCDFASQAVCVQSDKQTWSTHAFCQNVRHQIQFRCRKHRQSYVWGSLVFTPCCTVYKKPNSVLSKILHRARSHILCCQKPYSTKSRSEIAWTQCVWRSELCDSQTHANHPGGTLGNGLSVQQRTSLHSHASPTAHAQCKPLLHSMGRKDPEPHPP